MTDAIDCLEGYLKGMGDIMTKTEKLKLWVAEQFYGGYCEPEERDGYEWQSALSNATQTLKVCKESGLEWSNLGQNASIGDVITVNKGNDFIAVIDPIEVE